MLRGLPQTEVHFCAYGGARHKRTLLKGIPTWLQALCRTCDGNHFHAPWKDSLGIHTAEEAAYPLPFCQAICQLLRDSLPTHSRPRPVFVGKALPQWRNLPSPFDLQPFPQDLFDTAWFRGKRLPAGPWPKGAVLPLHPPEAAQGQFWAACPKDPVHYMQAMNGAQHPANLLPLLNSSRRIPLLRSWSWPSCSGRIPATWPSNRSAPPGFPVPRRWRRMRSPSTTLRRR